MGVALLVPGDGLVRAAAPAATTDLGGQLAAGAAPLPDRSLGAAAPARAEAPLGPLHRVHVPHVAADLYARLLRALPGVRAVEPTARVPAAIVPNDPYFAEYQWNLRQIRAPDAWDLTTGDRRVVIAILDTGIALDHPDLADKLVPGINLVTIGQPPADDNGHGTHVAGIVAAATNNAQGIAGVDWEARLMPVKVLDANGSSDVVRVAQGITWAVDQGARVLNLSFGGTEYSPALAEAVQYARSRGALVVAAVANDGRAEPTYPAALEGVLAVGATDRRDQPLPSSNTGSYIAVAAPGQEVPSTFWDPQIGNTYALASTTSQAAPHVAGLAGLLWSVNPELRGDAVRALIENHADDVGPPGRDDATGAGRINAYRSVLAALPWHYDSGGAAAYRAPAEPAPRLFLPYVVKARDGWTSSITVRNPLAQPVALSITFLRGDGTVVTAVGASLNPFGATTLPLQLLTEVPAGFQGAAVIDAGSAVTAVVQQDRAGASRHGYVAVSAGAARLAAPLVGKGGRHGSTRLYLQNLADNRETAIVSYYTEAGALLGQDTIALAPRAAGVVRLAETPSLPDGFVGAAIVESAGGGPLGGVAVQLGPAGEAASYTLPTDSGAMLAAPLVFKNANGWSTGIQVFNLGPAAAQVTVTYTAPGQGPSGPAPPPTPPLPPPTTPPAGGGATLVAAAGAPLPGPFASGVLQDSAVIPPRGSAVFYQPANPALPDGYAGSATITAGGGAQLAAVINQSRPAANQLMSYTAVPAAAPVADVPLLTKDYGGWTAGLRVQNLAADPAEITITYYDQAGRALHATQESLPPGGGATFAAASLAPLPWGYVGAATVTSNGRPIAAVVNLLKPAP